MGNALDSLPERDSSGSKNTSSGPLSSLSGSVTPTEEIDYASGKKNHTDALSRHRVAIGTSSSSTNEHFAHTKTSKEEEHQNNNDRHRKKSGNTSKGRVSFESDLSVATPGVPPLDLATFVSSVNTTPTSSCQATPDSSPRYAQGSSLLKPKLSKVVKNRDYNRPHFVPEAATSHQDSSTCLLRASIAFEDWRKTNEDKGHKKYYDMDMKVLASGITPVDDNSARKQYLTRVNSDSYLPTPEVLRQEDFSGRNAASLHDISHVFNDVNFTVCSPVMYASECSRHTYREGSTTEKDNSRKTGILSDLPNKCQSLPSVVDAVAHDNFSSTFSSTSQKRETEAKYLRKHFTNKNSSESLFSDAGREQLATEIDTTDSKSDLTFSDTDSTQSFVSTSSISSFRQAIAGKLGKRQETKDTLQYKTDKVQSIGGPSNAFNSAKKNRIFVKTIQRPIATMTRCTQMPSPALVKTVQPKLPLNRTK